MGWFISPVRDTSSSAASLKLACQLVFFRGAPQPTLCVMIASDDRAKVVALAGRLRVDLEQEGIGFVTSGEYERVTG